MPKKKSEFNRDLFLRAQVGYLATLVLSNNFDEVAKRIPLIMKELKKGEMKVGKNL